MAPNEQSNCGTAGMDGSIAGTNGIVAAWPSACTAANLNSEPDADLIDANGSAGHSPTPASPTASPLGFASPAMLFQPPSTSVAIPRLSPIAPPSSGQAVVVHPPHGAPPSPAPNGNGHDITAPMSSGHDIAAPPPHSPPYLPTKNSNNPVVVRSAGRATLSFGIAALHHRLSANKAVAAWAAAIRHAAAQYVAGLPAGDPRFAPHEIATQQPSPPKKGEVGWYGAPPWFVRWDRSRYIYLCNDDKLFRPCPELNPNFVWYFENSVSVGLPDDGMLVTINGQPYVIGSDKSSLWQKIE